jgi:ribokinase
MKNILVVGDIYTETQFHTEIIPRENEFAFASESTTTVGSKTINVARVLAKLGNTVTFCGVVGNDKDGNQINSELKEFNINPLLTQKIGMSTGKISLITPKSGKSSVVLSSGANMALTPDLISQIEINQYDGVYTTTALPLNTLYRLAEICHKSAIPIFVDVPNQQVDLDLSQLVQVDFIMPNRQEAELISGQKINNIEDAKNIAKFLREKIQGSIIITLDKEGCVVMEANRLESEHFPVRNVETIDETGAGDIFRAAFVNKWLESSDITGSVKIALDLATDSVLIKGVNASIENVDSSTAVGMTNEMVGMMDIE